MSALSDMGRALFWRINARRLRIRYLAPNYAYREVFRPGDVVIDVGTGYEADFSLYGVSP